MRPLPNSDRWLWYGAIALLLAGCDESLPPRHDPVEFLSVNLTVPTAPIVIRHGYPIRASEGGILVSVSNLRDEVLQERALIRGRVHLAWVSDSIQQRQLLFDELNLDNRSMVRGSMLTIGVDSAARLRMYWDQRTDGEGGVEGDVPLWELVSLREKRNSRGELYYESDSVRMIAEGWVQVFENVQRKKIGPLRVAFVYDLIDTLIRRNAIMVPR